MRQAIDRTLDLACDSRDDAETRRSKRFAIGFVLAIVPFSTAWGALYLAFGEVVAAVFPIGYAPLALLNLAVTARTRDFATFRVGQSILYITLPLGIHLSLGGFQASSAVVLWSLFAPLAGLAFGGSRIGVFWLVLFLGELVVATLLQWRTESALPRPLVEAFFLLNLGTVSAFAFFTLARSRRLLELERARSESLLWNVLPPTIAARLREGEPSIADGYEAVTVLFTDVVGSTPLTARLSPHEVVGLLNEHFTAFDELAERHGVEKVRTMGDNWMGVAGAPVPRPDHAVAVARLALAMREWLDERRRSGLRCLDFRTGLNSGPAVGGVIGTRKMVFDVWGDAVNIAARMESHGEAGRIQISDATHELIHDSFVCEPRGMVEVKGKGAMRTWYLVAERAAGPADTPVPSLTATR